MSRVHISYEFVEEVGPKKVFKVISPDFSAKGDKHESIGELFLDMENSTFKYSPIERLKERFCPPEYFVVYSGDTNKVNSICKEKGFKCTAWSYQVYRQAERLLGEKLS